MESAVIGIREAKIHLSKYLRMVQKGYEITLTDRGRPIGKIVPIETEKLPLAERLKRLEDRGDLGIAPGKIKRIPSPIPLPNDIAQRFLREDREHG